ncbi:MAG: ROK family protein [Phycisphaeraceae bacterium]|nr:ROK family protein [Phycisphaeraceae bacterium]
MQASPEKSRVFAGIDLGGTNMQIGIVRREPDGACTVIAREKKKTKADEGLDRVLDRISRGLQAACSKAGLGLADLAALGIGAPGVIDPFTGVVVEAVNLRWTDIPFARLLNERFTIPAYVENDVNVAVLGEARLGAGVGARCLLGVWVGTGIGGGLMFNGDLHYGHWLSAGEIGHMWVLPQSAPGSRSLEHNCSRTAIVNQIVKLIRANRKSMITELVEGHYDKIKSSDLARAYEAADPLVVEVVDHAAELLGIHIGSVNTLLSLDCVVLGGGVTEALGEPWVRRVAEWVRRVSFPEKAKGVRVEATRLGPDAGVIGAAMIAAERMGNSHYSYA